MSLNNDSKVSVLVSSSLKEDKHNSLFRKPTTFFNVLMFYLVSFRVPAVNNVFVILFSNYYGA